MGLIFALTSTTDGDRRYTAQPFRLQDNLNRFEKF